MATTPPRIPGTSKSTPDNVYYCKTTDRTASYVDGSWLCSCEQRQKMRPGIVKRGPNIGRHFLNCRRYRESDGCGVFLLRDDSAVMAIENRINAIRNGGIQTTLNSFVTRTPRHRDAADAVSGFRAGPRAGAAAAALPSSPQQQPPPSPSISSAESNFCGEDDMDCSSPCPSPTRKGATAAAAPRRSAVPSTMDLPSRSVPSAQQLSMTQPPRFSLPGDPMDEDPADSYGSWDDETTANIIELTDSCVKSRSKGKGPDLGELSRNQTATPSSFSIRRTTQNNPPISIRRGRLDINEAERASRSQATQAPVSTEKEEEEEPAIQYSSQAPKQSIPGRWESSPSSSPFSSEDENEEFVDADEIDHNEEEADQDDDDENNNSVNIETPSRKADVANGLPTPITNHNKGQFTNVPGSLSVNRTLFQSHRAGAAASSTGTTSSSGLSPIPSNQIHDGNRQGQDPRFEDTLMKDVLSTLENDGIQLSLTAKRVLNRKLSSFAGSVKKIRRDRNVKKKQARRFRKLLEEEQGHYRSLRNQKETAQVELMGLMQNFDDLGKARDELCGAADYIAQTMETAKMVTFNVLGGMDAIDDAELENMPGRRQP
ncbi:hypothetical protein MKZ38_007098 [Zalerion maritima]|uniref:GRF-type domain-containing protein n=1 Tax=Zalerion maritima TaxID=339359 RepID=A0AAD5RN05_9PEZI|nr:hypothetical protein MKZ38_007098 [Zalerion maritima]